MTNVTPFNNTIFALDDEFPILELFRDILTDRKTEKISFFDAFESKKNEKASYDLRAFATTRLFLEGLESWYEQGYRVPLSILDMRLPQMHGLEVAKRARELDKEMVIIVVTAYADHTVEEILGQLQSNVFYLRKPFGHDELRALVATSMRNWNEKANIATIVKDIAIDVTEDGMWDWNPITNAVFYSLKWKQMLGYAEDEIQNHLDEWSKRVHPQDIEGVKQVLQEHLEQKSDYYISEHRLLCKDGSYKWILDRGKASFLPSGQPCRVVGFHTDISKRKALEEELFSKSTNLSQELKNLLSDQTKLKNTNKTLEEQLQDEIKKRAKQEELLLQCTRQAAMGEMIRMIAHQWRQPLSTLGTVLIKLKALKNMGELDSEHFDIAIEKASNQIAYMSKTIDDFGDFFKNDNTIQNISLEKIIEAPKHILEPLLASKEISFEVTYGIDKNISLQTVGSKLSEVLLNIYKNAIEQFECKNVQNPLIQTSFYQANGGIIIVICDNAGGLEEESMAHIYEPYFSTKSKNGAGLGLYMSQKIVQEMFKGALRAYNQPNGACFEIFLPTTLPQHDASSRG